MLRPLLAATCAVLLFAACPPPRIEFGPKGEIDDPEALLRLVDEASERVVSLNGESKVRVDTPEAKGAFSMFVAVEKPANVHLEPLDFFGKPQAVLVVNGDRFGLYQAQDNRYYQGPASPENVSRFLPIVLPAPELVQILLGATPRLPHESVQLSTDDQCLCYVLTLRRGSAAQILQIHPRTYRVLKSEIRGAPAYDLAYEDFAEYGRISFPRRIKLTAAHAGVALDLRYTEVALNQPIDEVMFDPAAPEGVEVVEIDNTGRPTGSDVPPPSGPQLQPDPAEPPPSNP